MVLVKSVLIGKLVPCVVIVLFLVGCGNEGADRVGTSGWGVWETYPSPVSNEVAFLGKDLSLPILDSGPMVLLIAGDPPVRVTHGEVDVLAAEWMLDGDTFIVLLQDAPDRYAQRSGKDVPDVALSRRLEIWSRDGRLIREVPTDIVFELTTTMAVHPNGSELVVWGRRRNADTFLWNLDLVSGESNPIEADGLPVRERYGDMGFVDDHRLVIAGPLVGPGAPENWGAVYLVDLQSKTARRLSRNDQSGVAPSVTPDGRYVVYEAIRSRHKEMDHRTHWYVQLHDKAEPVLLDVDFAVTPLLDASGESLIWWGSDTLDDTKIYATRVPRDVPWLR